MAVGNHIARLVSPATSAYGEARVEANGSIPNTANSPTLAAYLSLELAADYIPTLVTDRLVITVLKTDL